jgi:hypothetical protein
MSWLKDLRGESGSRQPLAHARLDAWMIAVNGFCIGLNAGMAWFHGVVLVHLILVVSEIVLICVLYKLRKDWIELAARWRQLEAVQEIIELERLAEL